MTRNGNCLETVTKAKAVALKPVPPVFKVDDEGIPQAHCFSTAAGRIQAVCTDESRCGTSQLLHMTSLTDFSCCLPQFLICPGVNIKLLIQCLVQSRLLMNAVTNCNNKEDGFLCPVST